MTIGKRLTMLALAFCCLPVSALPQSDCLSYETPDVKLTGRVIRKVFPGRPNYESLKKGDEPEPAWLLHLAKPICLKASEQNEVDEAEGRVTVIHLVLRGKQFAQLRKLRRKGGVTVAGSLFHSFTGHHHAAVLMTVSSIKGSLRHQGTRLPARNTKGMKVPITNISGVKLRQSPTMKAKVVETLGVGDEVEVIEKTVSDAGNEADALWALVKPYRSMKGDLDSHQRGWVLDKHLGYKNRFKRITSWKKESISAELGDYFFTIEVKKDGSFIHKWQPCIDCGEKPDCDKGEKKVGRECVSRGHLYRYGNFVWARKPTKYWEYLFIDKRGNLRSVYPEDR